ncbi:YwdI family protein [Metabacillus halosaccharovorans]|uniref:YwdI family protein n=1 Tax=Metabacillus halosaccharovorans TaxID=930124 RepID=UPI001C1FAF79|nr:YwdI family protein [Metabacillus halosaccharovorans]MBU7594283.1 hypothetical protein [Metabacillus halosaccharovorans]
MDIPISKLLSKMEAELTKAKNSQSEKERRERIVVIQSLCELILDEKSPQVQTITSPSSSSISPAELQKMMGNMATVVKNPSSSEVKKEDDANGDSLFDF